MNVCSTLNEIRTLLSHELPASVTPLHCHL